MLIQEATDDLRKWFDGWLEEHKVVLTKWLLADDIGHVVALRDKIYVGEKFELCFSDRGANRVGRILEYGSLDIPKFNFITRANSFLEGLFPKYEEAVMFLEFMKCCS